MAFQLSLRCSIQVMIVLVRQVGGDVWTVAGIRSKPCQGRLVCRRSIRTGRFDLHHEGLVQRKVYRDVGDNSLLRPPASDAGCLRGSCGLGTERIAGALWFRERGAEALPGGLEFFGHDAGFADHGHEIGVAVPAGEDV